MGVGLFSCPFLGAVPSGKFYRKEKSICADGSGTTPDIRDQRIDAVQQINSIRRLRK